MDKRRRKKVGDYGEAAAMGYLVAKGFSILAKNYEAGGGEIDIVAQKHEQDGVYIVFIEVKFRKQLAYGRPADAITSKKRRAMIGAAYVYLAENGRGDENCRFDVIEVFGREMLQINHIENAFGEN